MSDVLKGPDLDMQRAANALIALIQGLAPRWSLIGRAFDLVGEGERAVDLVLLPVLPLTDVGGVTPPSLSWRRRRPRRGSPAKVT